MRRFVFLHIFSLAVCLAQSAYADRQSAGNVTPEFEARLVELFSKNKCDEVREMVSTHRVSDFRANILAIAAYCEPAGENPAELFKLAEEKNPTGDLILVLHAKWLSKRDPKAAEPMWEKVLMLARTPYFEEMAHQYLEGNIVGDHPILLRNLTLYANVQIGGSHESNPKDPDFYTQTGSPSYALNVRANATAQRWFGFGSVSANYVLTDNHYFSSTNFDLVKHDFDFPIAVHVGRNEDIVFRPFGGYSTIGHNPYQALGGLGILGVIYRSAYRQSVQGLIFSDRIYPSQIEAQQGTHFRFQYAWEFFPRFWYLQGLFWIEHVEADNDVVDGVATAIPYSHSDVGFQTNLQHDFKLATLGFLPKLMVREDGDVSSYKNSIGQSVAKRRNDFIVSLQPSVTIPILPYVQLFTWYEWNRVFSNMGPGDYADRNLINHTVGVALRTSVSNY
jgi:hypothetical protein